MTSETTSLVAYKDLCIDATDPQLIADFYGSVVGLQVSVVTDDIRRLTGERAEQTIWVNRVPEPRSVKQRAHLDVHVRQVEDVVALGASIADEQPRWTVLADPEGGELCAFVRDAAQELPRYRALELVVDAADPAAIARWWGDRLGGTVLHNDEEGEEFSWIENGAGLPFELVFGLVPEPKTVKNRIHWDVWGVTAELLAAGATLLRGRDDAIEWDVLADPEGNEFCVFTRD